MSERSTNTLTDLHIPKGGDGAHNRIISKTRHLESHKNGLKSYSDRCFIINGEGHISGPLDHHKCSKSQGGTNFLSLSLTCLKSPVEDEHQVSIYFCSIYIDCYTGSSLGHRQEITVQFGLHSKSSAGKTEM